MNEEGHIVTKTGRVLTDADFERLADQAENDPKIRQKVQKAIEELEQEGKIVRDGDGYRMAKHERRNRWDFQGQVKEFESDAAHR